MGTDEMSSKQLLLGTHKGCNLFDAEDVSTEVSDAVTQSHRWQEFSGEEGSCRLQELSGAAQGGRNTQRRKQNPQNIAQNTEPTP